MAVGGQGEKNDAKKEQAAGGGSLRVDAPSISGFNRADYLLQEVQRLIEEEIPNVDAPLYTARYLRKTGDESRAAYRFSAEVEDSDLLRGRRLAIDDRGVMNLLPFPN